MKKVIKKIFSLFGFKLVKNSVDSSFTNRNAKMINGIERFQKQFGAISSIIDVGAAEGSWTLGSLEVYPNTNYLLFEPLLERKRELEILCKRNLKFTFINKGAGDQTSSIKFKVSDDLDGSGIANQKEIEEGNFREVEIVRIDEEIKKHELRGPYIVKLDTHGFEVPIIEGCENIMSEINLFIIECYGFYLTEKSLLFWEMCEYMDKKGFRLFDIVDVMRRSKDDAFWQCDAFFIPKNNPTSQSNTYL